MKFKVTFSGFAYVEADSEDEARESYEDGDTVYSEYGIDDIIEVEEFIIEM